MVDYLNYEIDLSKHYPQTIGELEEFIQIAKVENKNFNKVRIDLQKIFSTRFIHDLDDDGIARWEKMLKLKRQRTDDLELRRMRVLAKINNTLPYTWNSLRQLLDSVFGAGKYHLSLDQQDYVIELLIPSERNYYKELNNILEPMVPLNIWLIIAEGVVKEIIRITTSTYAWGFNKRITGRFKTASRPATITAERLAQKENIYAFPMHGRVSGRFRAGGAV